MDKAPIRGFGGRHVEIINPAGARFFSVLVDVVNCPLAGTVNSPKDRSRYAKASQYFGRACAHICQVRS
jgi:hypothetical protein